MSNGTNMNFPHARTADLVAERVGDELVVYDGQSSQAHCLSGVASAVFTAADGKNSPADLAAIVSRQVSEDVDVETIEQALAELEDRGLLETPDESGISRRKFMQHSAAVGGVVMAGTMVTSVVTPAYGGTGSGGTFGAYSSMALLFYFNGVYYGGHWNQGGPPTGGPPNNWGATEANANCQLTIPSGQSVSPNALAGVSATTNTGGGTITVTVPNGATIVSTAVFFGQGGPGCHGCQHPTVTGSGTTYTLTFSC